MNLVGLLLLPLAGGLLAFASGRASGALPRWITLATLTATLALAATLRAAAADPAVFSAPWIPQFGIAFALQLDGFSFLLILLSIVLSFLAVWVSPTSGLTAPGAYYFNQLWVLSGVLGVFLAADLFLFFFFWELMVVPMYFLIARWGGDKRTAAASKFFLFTQASGLLMLISTLGLAWHAFRLTGSISFAYEDLLGLHIPPHLAHFLFLGFFLAFAVKLPIAPFHAWQADAYTQAPTAGSIILAGFLSKTGGYGLIKFGYALFPEAAAAFAPWAFGLGVFTVLYGAMLAFAQRDAKRLIAYSSLSHMGFILLGAAAWNTWGLQGVAIFMLSHGFATSALFVLADRMEARLGHRDILAMGGLWQQAPRFSGWTQFFILMSLGLPASGNFIGEILILGGVMKADPNFAVMAGIALVFPAIYSLHFIQKTLHGQPTSTFAFPEMTTREFGLVVALALAVLALGLRPQPFLRLAAPALAEIQAGTGWTQLSRQTDASALPSASALASLPASTSAPHP